MSTLALYVWSAATRWGAGLKAKAELGQGMVEYGLILGLVAIAAVLVLTNLGGAVAAMFTGVSNALIP